MNTPSFFFHASAYLLGYVHLSLPLLPRVRALCVDSSLLVARLSRDCNAPRVRRCSCLRLPPRLGSRPGLGFLARQSLHLGLALLSLTRLQSSQRRAVRESVSTPRNAVLMCARGGAPHKYISFRKMRGEVSGASRAPQALDTYLAVCPDEDERDSNEAYHLLVARALAVAVAAVGIVVPVVTATAAAAIKVAVRLALLDRLVPDGARAGALSGFLAVERASQPKLRSWSPCARMAKPRDASTALRSMPPFCAAARIAYLHAAAAVIAGIGVAAEA